MKRLGFLLLLATSCMASDAVTKLKKWLDLTPSQQDVIVRLNRECDEFFQTENEAIQRLQAKRAVNPAANVSSALEQIQSDLWKKLVETNHAVRATLSTAQLEKADMAVAAGKPSELTQAVEVMRFTKDVKLSRTNGPSSGPVTQMNSGADIRTKSPDRKGK